ncbi:hypothetical protein B0H13DRAFT_165997 [Mycena leptocephala]|nr:hypothetical protein B0H13DRAFT_165997 [Mycena leptocephala]
MHNPDRKPFRLIIAGPGGAGKSHLYDALKAFYDELGILSELNFTAPTGVSASNIFGSTVHQELALRTKYSALTKNNSKPLKALIARLESTRTLVIDEYFFLGCDDFEKISRNINLPEDVQMTLRKSRPHFFWRRISAHRYESSPAL